jgi:hypothetical protein
MASTRSVRSSSRPLGKLRPMCRKMLPHSAPVICEIVNSSAELADSSWNRNHANPSSTMSMPMRLSGKRRHAYRPVAT